MRAIVHWPSVRGRARADAGALLLVAVVVAVVSLLAGATPALLRSTADTAVREAVTDAGTRASVTASSRWEYDDDPNSGGRIRDPKLAASMDAFRRRASAELDPGLARVLRAPVAFAAGPSLDVTDGSLLRTFQFNYLADSRGPMAAGGVTWVAGRAPRASSPPDDPDILVSRTGAPWPVQVGVSESAAAALKLGPGDRIPLKDKFLRPKAVEISGVFRANDPADPAWRLAPWLLHPVSSADGVGNVRLGGLLSADSLPDARLAVESDEFDRTVHFDADPARLAAGNIRDIAETLVRLKATSSVSTVNDESVRWSTLLDDVLREVQIRVNAAAAQAAVLLAGVLTGTILVLLLAAALLARRRAPALTTARQRGTGLPVLAVELVLESVTVAVLAAAAGLAVARLVTPGVSWWWALPVVIAAIAAGPAYGCRIAARATSGRRAPANRSARRRLQRTALLRRVALEGAVLLVAAGAVVALRQRGILPATDQGPLGADPFAESGSTSALAAAAPSLGVVAGALILLRVLPVALRFVLRRALRSNRSLTVFGTAQAVANATRTLPILVLVAVAALATFSMAVASTTGSGLEDASWRQVGADVRVDAGPTSGVDVAAMAREIAAAPGVEHVVTGEVIEEARIANASQLVPSRLVLVDAAGYARLLAGTPIDGGAALTGLAGRPGGEVPALVRSASRGMAPGARLEFPRKDAPSVRLIVVGAAPVLGDSGDAVYVDAAAARAAGVTVAPNTLWVTGPGAARALQGRPGVAVTVRTELAAQRRAAPLTGGLLTLTWVAAATLAALGLLGFALATAAGAPQRWITLGRLRTLGLRLRDTRTVTAGELLPPVLLAVIGGPLLGLLLAALTFGSLALRLLIGWDIDPPMTAPWWPLAVLAAVLLAAVPVAGAVETAARRRQGLGELLRVGD